MDEKILKAIFLLLLVIVLIAGGALFFFVKSLLPEQEEYIVYDKDKQIALIDAQLQGLDLEKIRAKAPLILDQSVEAIQVSITNKELTYEELTAFYLDRIKTYDTGAKGINAVAEINPNAIKEARAQDATSNKKSKMSGIPVLIKDNINTKNTPTSAGTYALKDFTPAENAPMVEALLQNGAIILGKANLSEMANFMDTKMPSGYSSKAGQTHNPFNPITLSPQGSSSGSGAGVAANLSAVAIGTETTGSIIAPAAIHSVVGYKPTKNMIATDGVVPLSSTMDTVGTLTKTVEDTVLLFNASVSDASKKVLQPTDPSYLAGKKIGVGGQNTDLLVQKLKDAGAEVVTVTLDEKDIDNGVIINQDFKHDLNQYLTRYNAPVKSLSELITFNKEDKNRRAKYGQRLIEEAESNKDTDRAKVDRMVQEAQKRINTLMTEQQLDAIAFVDNEGVVLPAVAGYPVITVPLGATEDGTPLGATFTAKAQEDAKLLQIAYSFEQKTGGRLIPEKYKNQF